MPVVDLQPKRPDQREMTEIEQRHARLIGVLMSCAKNLQSFRKSVQCGDAEAGAATSVQLTVCLHKLCGYDAAALERDTLALAEILGFNVQQFHVGANTRVSH